MARRPSEDEYLGTSSVRPASNMRHTLWLACIFTLCPGYRAAPGEAPKLRSCESTSMLTCCAVYLGNFCSAKGKKNTYQECAR